MVVKPYEARFKAGAQVRVRPREELERFKETWRYHHPLSSEQVTYAGALSVVKEVAFYHGGDPLYQLAGIPGIWHEECLSDP
jgi:hypothetical protein